jgi:hypothetical protein
LYFDVLKYFFSSFHKQARTSSAHPKFEYNFLSGFRNALKYRLLIGGYVQKDLPDWSTCVAGGISAGREN